MVDTERSRAAFLESSHERSRSHLKTPYRTGGTGAYGSPPRTSGDRRSIHSPRGARSGPARFIAVAGDPWDWRRSAVAIPVRRTIRGGEFVSRLSGSQGGCPRCLSLHGFRL